MPFVPTGSCGEDGKGDRMSTCLVLEDKGAITFFCGHRLLGCYRSDQFAVALCDWPMGDGKTCDIPLCERHRVSQGGELQDIDFCPEHALVARGLVRSPKTGTTK